MKAARQTVWMVVPACLLLAGCAARKEANSTAAVQQAIEQHLAGRPGLASDKMILEIKGVQVQGERAEADVVFHSRSDPAAQMAFHYQLRKQGNQWKVETGRPSATTSLHPPSSDSNAAPGAGNPPSAGGSLPEGHPPIEAPPPKQ